MCSNTKDSENYVLELTRQETVLLGHIILSGKLYCTSYEPLSALCGKIDNLCKEVYKAKKNNNEIPRQQKPNC